MSLRKQYPYLEGKVVHESSGENRATRRGYKMRRLYKQFHLTGRKQCAMAFVEYRRMK